MSTEPGPSSLVSETSPLIGRQVSHVNQDFERSLSIARSYSLPEWVDFAMQSDQVVTCAVQYKFRVHWYHHDAVLLRVKPLPSQPDQPSMDVMITCDIRGTSVLSYLSPFGQTNVRFLVLAEGTLECLRDNLASEALNWTPDTASSLQRVTTLIFHAYLDAPPHFVLQNHCRAFISFALPVIQATAQTSGIDYRLTKRITDFCRWERRDKKPNNSTIHITQCS